MTESECVSKYIELKKRAEVVGITPLPKGGIFEINDVPKSNGVVIFNNLLELEVFIRGYELGYLLKWRAASE